MIRDYLRYHRPASEQEASRLLLESGPDAAVLGGGTMLIPQLTRAERRVRDVVDLRGLGLDRLVVTDDRIEIGAMVTYGTVLRAAPLPGAARLLQQLADVVTGGSQIRNLGTLGGSAAYANPSSDVPGALVALQSTMVIAGPDGRREVAAGDFLLDAHKTALGPGELLVGIRVPAVDLSTGYVKLKAASSGWPVVTASAVVGPAQAWVTVGAAQAVPVRIDVSAMRRGDRWDAQAVMAEVRSAISDPWHDSQATAQYRKHVAGVLARRALERSAS